MKTYQENEMFCLLEFGKNTLIETQKTELIADNMIYCMIAKKWNISERSVRNYCAQGRVLGAFLNGKTWNIPENAENPERINKR